MDNRIRGIIDVIIDMGSRLNRTYDILVVGVGHFVKYGLVAYLLFRFFMFILHLFV